jgi:hypothetical protein
LTRTGRAFGPAVVAALALAGALASGAARAAGLPTGYLVWSRGTPDDPASRTIHRMTLPGRDDVKALTAGEDIQPQISPDGRWVAYAKAKFPGGSDYHDPRLWKLFVVSIHGAGQGRREIKIDDDGAWPSWSSTGALFYNQADGTHTRLVRVTLDDRGQVTARAVVLASRELFGGFTEVNEVAIAPDESWFVARTRGNTSQNGVGAFTIAPPGYLPLARAGEIGCIPRMAPSGRFAVIAGASEGIRWGHGPQIPDRKQDQLLIPPLTPGHKAYHPGIASDERWVLSSQGTDADHNSGRYDLHIHALDPAAMVASDDQPLTSADFNGWPHLWVGPPGPPPPPRPEVAAFYASSYTVGPGEPVTLTWSTFGADQVTLDGAAVAPEGSQEIAAPQPLHRLDARSSLVSDIDARTVSITVNATPQPVAIELFAADPPRLQKGQSTVLSWLVKNATTLDLDGARALPAESREVTPLMTTTYLLSARGSGGPVQARVTVTVEAQQTGLLPDRGGFRCALGGGQRPPAAASGIGALAAALALRRRSRRRRT